MTLTPYPSRSKIAAAAARSGHVVSTKPDVLQIETPALTITFNPDETITDGNGKSYDMTEALRVLDITLS